jgi:hypothetical protein
MPRRLLGVLGAIALQLVALVLAHELVFLARWGSRYNEALAHGGHGASWSTAVITVLALGVLLASLAAWRLFRLGWLVRGTTRRDAHSQALSTLPHALARAWLLAGPRTAFLTATLLTIQEHLERSATGFGPTGPGILLAPEYAGGLWIALGVGLVVGLIAGLFEWRHRALLARLRAARPPRDRASAGAEARPGILVLTPAESILGRRFALRAPPAPLELLPAG